MQGSDNISTCRHCRFYQLEGRRGGNCQQLGALVQGRWKACQLAVPAFVQSWEQEEMKAWKLEAVELAESCFSVSRSTLNNASSTPICSKGLAENLAKDLVKENAELRSMISVSAIVLSKRHSSPLAPLAQS